MDIPEFLYKSIVQAALAEDIDSGDITTDLCIPADAVASATLVAKEIGVIAGLDIARLAFTLLDPDLEWEQFLSDGDSIDEDCSWIATVKGDARAILTAERVALNFLQRLSGIATLTARYVAAIEGSGARIVDTRKTTPGLRLLEKYAVRVGGGFNHRYGLSDCVLIKDNHIQAAGGIEQAVVMSRKKIPHTVKIEVETETFEQVQEALDAKADIILLDNMTTEMMCQAVEQINGRAIAEASGGLSLDRVAEVAATGVQVLSVGALTHSAPALDISLDFNL